MKKLGFKPISPVWDWLISRAAWRPGTRVLTASGRRPVRQRMILKPVFCAPPKACAKWPMDRPTITACSMPARRTMAVLGVESVNGLVRKATGIE